MGDRSRIEWTEATWNPVTGCSKVSPGCAHCYAERLALRFGWSQKPWTAANAAENVKLHPDRLDLPLRWRKPRMVFVNSMSDLFHEQVPIDFIARVFNVMASATAECGKNHRHTEECWTGPRHTFQILTKRPERMRRVLDELPHYVAERFPGDSPLSLALEFGEWPLPNVWLGVSVEDQRWADERIPHLLATPAAVRFLSCEPLLGPVTLPPEALGGYPESDWWAQHGSSQPRIDWVIVGGESGPKARPMHPDWARSLRDQCQAVGVAFFFKQWGGRNKKAAGRVLDGRTWDEMPEPQGARS